MRGLIEKVTGISRFKSGAATKNARRAKTAYQSAAAASA